MYMYMHMYLYLYIYVYYYTFYSIFLHINYVNRKKNVSDYSENNDKVEALFLSLPFL